MRLPDVLLCLSLIIVGRSSAFRQNIFRCFAEEEKVQQNAKKNAAIREISVETRRTQLITTLNSTTTTVNRGTYVVMSTWYVDRCVNRSLFPPVIQHAVC